MSFGFSVGDFLTVLKLVSDAHQRWKDAPVEYSEIGKEIASLEDLLQIIDNSREKYFQAAHQKNLENVVAQCKIVLTEAVRIATAFTRPSSNKVSKLWKRLKADPQDVRRIRDRLVFLIAQLNSIQGVVQTENLQSIQVNQHSEKKFDIANWYSSVTFAEDQDRNLSLRQPDTATWFLQHPTYKDWRQEPCQTLFCPGIHGAGKSVTFATVVDDLHRHFEKQTDTIVAYFYCDFKRQDKQTLPYILSTFVRQLFQEQESIPQKVLEVYEKHVNRVSRPSLDELQSLIGSLTNSYSRVFFLVDALDECSNVDIYRTRDGLLSFLLKQKSNANANIMVTSRPNLVENYPINSQLEIRSQPEDITLYLKTRVAKSVECLVDRPDLQQEVVAEIVKVSDGMFLLARLHLESLSDQINPREVLGFLQALPRGSTALDQAYSGVIDRIHQQKPNFKNLAQNILMWVTLARRELTIMELQEALAIKAGMSDIDPESDFVRQEIIIRVCAGLITVSPESNTVKLTHATAQVFLEGHKDQWLPDSGEDIAHKCIIYLSMPTFYADGMHWRMNFYEKSRKYKLLYYIGKNWGFHLHDGDDIPHFAKSAIDRDDFRCFATQLALGSRSYKQYSSNVRGSSPLHLLTYFDCKAGLRSFLKKGHNPNSIDTNGQSALHIAAEYGCEAAASTLLSQQSIGSSVNLLDERRETPLSLAALRGYTKIVAQLLARDDIGPSMIPDKWNESSLLKAAWQGNVEIVAQLLARDDIGPTVNLPGFLGKTPLHNAASKGHTEIMAQLLARDDIRVNLPDAWGKTPLSEAASEGRTEIVAQLLARDDIDPSVNLQDEGGETPLSEAAFKGHTEIVAQLLVRGDIDLSVNLQDEESYTPLAKAVHLGHTEIVAQLLVRDDIDPSVKLQDILGETPLFKAASQGHTEIVAQLLARGDIGTSVNLLNKYGRTPLAKTARSGHTDIVAQLLARDDSGPSVDLPDTWGKTPLSEAAFEGHIEIVAQLLARDDIRVNLQDKEGGTPLSQAAYRGHTEIVAQLLARDDIGLSVNLQDKEGRTPLSEAAYRGYTEIVAQLLARDDIGLSVNLQDKEGRTPLFKAASYGYTEIVAQLLARDDIGPSVNLQDKEVRTPLDKAASYGYTEIVAQLLARDDIGPSVKQQRKNGRQYVSMSPAAAAQFRIINQQILDWASSHPSDV